MGVLKFFEEVEIKEENSCKGIVYRGKRSLYLNGSEIHERVSLIPLKRNSCKGCESCISLEDLLTEHLSCVGDTALDLSKVEQGGLYRIVYIPDPPAWESNISEDGEFKVVDVRNEI